MTLYTLGNGQLNPLITQVAEELSEMGAVATSQSPDEKPTEGESFADKTPVTSDQPSFSQKLGAAFNLNTMTGNVLGVPSINRPFDVGFNESGVFLKERPRDPNFNPASHIQEGDQPILTALMRAYNVEEMEDTRKAFAKRNDDREILNKAGSIQSIIFTLAANIIDPANMMIFPKIASLAKLGMSLLPAAASTQATRGLATGGMFGLGAGTVSYVTQPETPASNIAWEGAGAAILGGAFGKIANLIEKSFWKNAVKEVNEIVTGQQTAKTLSMDKYGTLSETITMDTGKEVAHTLTDAKLARLGRWGQHVKYNPVTQGLNSPFESVRLFTNDLYRHKLMIEQHAEGLTSEKPTVHALMQFDEGTIITAHRNNKAFYYDYLGLQSDSTVDAIKAKFTSKNFLSYDEFKTEVSRAIRDGDKHSIPQVEQAARKVTKNIIHHFRDKAIDVGLLSPEIREKDPLTAVQHLIRVYDTNLIRKERTGWNSMVDGYLTDINNQIKEGNAPPDDLRFFTTKGREKLRRIETLEKELKEGDPSKSLEATIAKLRKEAVQERRKVLTPEEIIESRDNISDHVLRNSDSEGRVSAAISPLHPTPKIGAERRFLAPDALLEKYLINDIEQLMNIYGRNMSTAVRLQEFYQAHGHENVEGFLKTALTQKNEMIKALEEQKKIDIEKIGEDKAIKKFDKKVKSIEKDFTHNTQLMVDGVKLTEGTFGINSTPENHRIRELMNNIKLWNAGRSLGYVLLTSIPDIGMFVKNLGFTPAITGLLKSLHPKIAKLSRIEMKQLSVAIERERGHRVNSITSNDKITGDSWIQKIVNKAQGLSMWDDMLKRKYGTIVADNILSAVERVVEGRATKKDLPYLASQRIHPQYFNEIHQNFLKHGETVLGVKLGNMHLWGNRSQEVMASALITDANATIITPGRGELPRFLQTPLGRLFFQFKSFGVSMVQNFLIHGLQKRDLAVANSIAVMIVLEGLSTTIKDKLRGRETVYDTKFWLTAGANALVPFIMNQGALLEALRINELFGGTKSSWSGSKFANALVRSNPTLSLGQEVYNLAMSPFSEQGFTDKDLKNAGRLLPLYNLFYIESVNKYLLEKGGELAGVKRYSRGGGIATKERF